MERYCPTKALILQKTHEGLKRRKLMYSNRQLVDNTSDWQLFGHIANLIFKP